MHMRRQSPDRGGDLWHIRLADPPFDGIEVHTAPAQEMPVPDRTARGPAIHPQPLASEIRGSLHRTVFTDVEIACGEIIPASPGTLCALGAVAAAIRRDTMRTVLLPLEDATWPQIQTVLDALADEASASVAAMAGRGENTVIRAVDLRYRGQSFELTVPLGVAASAAELADQFHAAHGRAFGHADPNEPVQEMVRGIN
jgi:hypothetical protein